MAKVKTFEDLKLMRDKLQLQLSPREKSEHPDEIVQIKVSMATCGIASGAKKTMTYLIEELDSRGVQAIITQAGCMGYCHSEPIIEVHIPGSNSIVYGNVDILKAEEIITKYIIGGELVDGIIKKVI